jgi:sigma-B regulation protein RsbU (phosphoserine phosphatase)
MLGSKAVTPATTTLAAGDTLLMYTDGVIEVTDANDAEFGEARLTRVLSESADRPAAGIVSALLDATRRYSGLSRFDDDFTLVVIKRLG